MLPSRCIQPPCRNMEVNGDGEAGYPRQSGGNRASVSSTAGIAPNAATAWRPDAASSERCHRKTQAQPAISDTVTTGFQRGRRIILEWNHSLRAVRVRTRRAPPVAAAPSLAALLFGANLLRLRLLARDFLEHHLHPLAAHSACRSQRGEIDHGIDGRHRRPGDSRVAPWHTRASQTGCLTVVFMSSVYSGAINLRRPMVFKYSSSRGKLG